MVVMDVDKVGVEEAAKSQLEENFTSERIQSEALLDA